jgi:acetoacetate decarboxylase
MNGGTQMRALDVSEQFTTPIDSPAYSMALPRFTDREYLNITYRSDLDVLRRLVPEPLTVVDPLVRFEMMRMPDSTGLGDYRECGQLYAGRHTRLRIASCCHSYHGL